MTAKNTTLTLSLKRKWFDLIKSGIKLEEYREMSLYWKCRFLHQYNDYALEHLIAHKMKYENCYERVTAELENQNILKHFDTLVFTLGYPKKTIWGVGLCSRIPESV